MKRIAPVVVTLLMLGLLPVPDVFAGGGFGAPPPDKTAGPSLDMSVVMGPDPSDPTLRQFTLILDKGRNSKSAMFTGTRAFAFGCMQDGFPSLKASTEQRFLGFMSNWAPFDVVEVFTSRFGNPDLAVIVAIHDSLCTTVGDQEYLSFDARVRFAKE